MTKNFSAVLVKGLGKKAATDLAKEACLDHSLYKSLLEEIERGEMTPAMKAAWILSNVTNLNHSFPLKHAKEILKLLAKAQIGGVQRELLKTLYKVSLKENEYGQYIDISFRILANRDSDIAVKYHCCLILEEAVKKYPEIGSELIALLEAQQFLYTEAWQRYSKKKLEWLRKRDASGRRVRI